MNHAAHMSNMLRTAAQKKKQQSSRNTAHVRVTSNYEKFAQQFSKDHGTKSQPTDQSSHQQQQLQQPRSHYRRASSRLPEVDDPEAEQLCWDDDDELEGLSAEHPSKARLAYDRWVSKNRRKQASDVENQLQSNRTLSASPSKKAAEAAALYERQNASANVVLYVGLGMVSIGLIITFVGVGEKGFSASELKMVGPSLVGAGVFFCFLRVFFCTCPHCCRKHCCCQFPCCIQRGGPDDGAGRKREGEDEDGVLTVAARRPSAHANDFATKSVTGGAAAGPSTSTAYHQPRALPSSAGTGSRSNPSARPRTSQQHAAATIAAALEEGTAVNLTAVVTDDPGRNRPRARRHSARNSRKNRPVAIKNDDDDDDDDLEDILGDEASGATPSVPPPDYYAGVPKFPAIPSPSVSGSRMNIPEGTSSGRGSNFGDTAGGGSSSSFHSATPDVEAVAIAPLSPAFPQQQPTTSSSNKTTSSSGVVLSASALEAP